MKPQEIKTVIGNIKQAIPRQANGADLAHIYVLLGIELGLAHLLQSEALSDSESPLPETAPERYQKRADKRERPWPFIMRVYADWLGKGLAQHHLLHLDKPLYAALHCWLLKNDKPEGFDLPSKKEINDRELEQLGIKDGALLPYPSYYKGLKDKLRLYNAARNRAPNKD
ncbi:MAG: hypothetical protein COA52_11535 [Hyphomicrobiales bacterium]|nr:MAG: hypothetical protein COA52_11535 [Hyphomicrobiales bacterium]